MTTNLSHRIRPDPSGIPEQLTKAAAWHGCVSVAAAVLLLSAAENLVKAAEDKGLKTAIPKIANIARIQVGYSSMEELETQLGKGKVGVGGHPNGARVWRVRGTSWVVHADAFEYSQRGAVVDTFDIDAAPKPGRGLPFARLAKNDFRWLGKICLGMEEDKLLKILKQSSWAATEVPGGWLVKANGCSRLTSNPIYPFQEWTARFRIEKKSLVGIQLYARQANEMN